jgi:hypothetical protein
MHQCKYSVHMGWQNWQASVFMSQHHLQCCVYNTNWYFVTEANSLNQWSAVIWGLHTYVRGQLTVRHSSAITRTIVVRGDNPTWTAAWIKSVIAPSELALVTSHATLRTKVQRCYKEVSKKQDKHWCRQLYSDFDAYMTHSSRWYTPDPLHIHHWHLSTFTTVTSWLVSLRRRNQCQVSVARWQLASRRSLLQWQPRAP